MVRLKKSDVVRLFGAFKYWLADSRVSKYENASAHESKNVVYVFVYDREAVV